MVNKDEYNFLSVIDPRLVRFCPELVRRVHRVTTGGFVAEEGSRDRRGALAEADAATGAAGGSWRTRSSTWSDAASTCSSA